jgi:transglycosylase-like protein with SLT domain
MKALQATCIVGAIAFTVMIHQLGGNPPGASVPDAMPEAAVSAETPGALALSAAVPEAPAGPATALGTAPGAEPGSGPAAVSGPSSMAAAETSGDSIETKSADSKSADLKSVDLKSVDLGHHDLGHHDAPQPVPTTRDASDNASNPAPATQDFRYLIYYVWSELPPAEKPAAIVLSSLKDTPAGTPVEEIKRASDAFGLDSNFMKAVARIESGFDPKQRTGSYIGLFQLSKYEFSKFGAGQILDPRDNAVAAAYKVITEGILFEWVTNRKPTLSDLYLIHQQGWEGAAEHISQPDRIAWRSMCATSEGMEKGEKWCKRAIWRNTLPAVKQAWKSVDKLTSGAFVGMWRERVADFYSKYMATAAAAAERANP